MLCGVKFNLDYSAIDQLLKNQNLEFKSLVNLETSEVDRTRVWTDRGMTIMIKSPGYGIIKGSLHKFKNGGIHNHDDFNWNEAFQTIDDLSDTLGLQVKDLNLVNLEWGLNIETDIPPKEIINGLVMHHGVDFKKMYVSPGTCSICQHAQFAIKVYDKGKQSHLSKNLMRIEVSANKSIYYNSLGVNSLHDLVKEEVRANLQNSLIYVWMDSILIDLEMMQIHPSNKNDFERIAKWSNPNFWTRSTKQTREYNKKAYDRFRRKHGFVTKEIIIQRMLEKLKQF